jgi:hypothetical protein
MSNSTPGLKKVILRRRLDEMRDRSGRGTDDYLPRVRVRVKLFDRDSTTIRHKLKNLIYAKFLLKLFSFSNIKNN